MSQEIELKLSLPRQAVPALRRHALFAGAAPQGRAVTLENVYYDTADLALKARRVGLRTRRQGRVWLQTVKCAAESSGGLSQRPEWEGRFDGSFDFSAIDDPKVAKLLERHRGALTPVFSTRFRRETRVYAPDEGVRILMMVDTGEIIAGEHREPISELELELERGEPIDLLLLACQLVADLPLLPEDASKAERGYRLHLGEAPRPVLAEPSRIQSGQNTLEAFRTLAFSCMRQWQANAQGAARSEDPEFIHQLRVGLRRLRSLLRLFGPVLPPEFVVDWSERLRLYATGFGDARDVDVFLEEILAPVLAARENEPAMARLAELAHAERDDARAAAKKRLDAAEQGRLLVGLTAALYALPDHPLPGAPGLKRFARMQLSALRKKARRRHQAAADLVPERLHDLRIAVKRLRYAIGFFAPLMPAKAAERYAARLARAQSALGFVHDVDVARERLARLAGDSPELREAAAFVCGWHAERYRRLSRRAMRELQPLLLGEAPWES